MNSNISKKQFNFRETPQIFIAIFEINKFQLEKIHFVSDGSKWNAKLRINLHFSGKNIDFGRMNQLMISKYWIDYWSTKKCPKWVLKLQVTRQIQKGTIIISLHNTPLKLSHQEILYTIEVFTM